MTDTNVLDFVTLPTKGASPAKSKRPGLESTDRSSNKPSYREIPQIIITEQSKQKRGKCNTNKPSGKYIPVVFIKGSPE